MTTRRTAARLAIAAELLTRRDAVHWGYELSRGAGVGAGSMYPFLSELLDQGYLTDEWEDPAKVSGRPPRRAYRVTDEGEAFLRQFLQAAPLTRSRRSGMLRPAVER